MVIYFMISKLTMTLCYNRRDLLVHVGKNAVAASRENLFLQKNEKDELGFQALPCKQSKVGVSFFEIFKAFR